LLLDHQTYDRLVVIGLGEELRESLGSDSPEILALLLRDQTILLDFDVLHAFTVVDDTPDICISGIEGDFLVD
jgi:hypothetical protein